MPIVAIIVAILAPLAAQLIRFAVSRRRLNNLFSTHPPVEERVAALRAM